ncbi:(deoxy)nucleoside triphosphate pyrophosphohydrolase [Bacillus suaedaesalsae]|uniref:8-oxo-dGTP diphosphatase n=1 Tax=Bacillus suaedaesalsae TaxID=2810349 RepID=A0ABS2DJK3_9BACI|nr:(deoxy)nucleoside triphosphate pyrophosphohydrolase [Bacillus suaedaesalsae]MBM6617741.1 (deoxy)nucleoside triphosphate pyrophosphohydrolase [Bacillus suaedaesalsae]
MNELKVVGAVIVNDLGEILCAKRSTTMSMPGKWEFPGGKVERNENEQDALIREIKEELQCDIEVYDKIAETLHEYAEFTILLVTYNAKITSGSPVNKEHEELRWFKLEQLKALDWAEADIPTVKLLLM